MDPLSIIASSIAIATPISIGLQKLRDARNARGELLLLLNEVSEVIIILQELGQILHSQHSHTHTGPNLQLVQPLHDVRAKLELLLKQVTEWNSIFEKTSKPLSTSGRRWLSVSSKVKAFKDELKSAREQLSILLSVLNLSNSTRVEVDLREIFVIAKGTEASQRSLRGELRQGLNGNQEMLEALLEKLTLNPSSSPLGAREHSETSDILEVPRHEDGRGVNLEDPVRAFRHNGSILFESAQMTAVAAVGIRTVQFTRTVCTPWCSCICHQERTIRTPHILDQFIGSLFIGYSGLPVCRPACNEKSCHLRSQPLAYVTYFFPRWFLSRMVTFMMTYTPLAGPVASLRVQRAVSGDADVFKYAKTGDVDQLKLLFENGLASPHDVHYASGVTPLHIAISHQHLDVCKLLLKANADPFAIDQSNWSAADNAWNKILCKSFPVDSEQRLRLMFSETEYLERKEFSVLHKIVLGLLNKDLAKELKGSTAEINTLDAVGRTPLLFAAERGDADAVSILLEYGANPTIPWSCGAYPLHGAASAKEPDCIPLLLNAGAEVDCVTNWAQTPLIYAAAYVKDTRHAKLLLEAGADPNFHDRDGITPLGWSAISNNPGVAALLIEHGAEIESIDLFGSSALQECIRGNRYEVLKMLMERKPRILACFVDESAFWQLITSQADPKTMHLLQIANFDGIVADNLQNVDLETMKQRATYSAEFAKAFRDLVDRIRVNEFDDSETEDDIVWEDALECL